MLIDSHAHLVFDNKYNLEMFENMDEQGLEKIINIGTDAFDSTKGVELAHSTDNIYTTVGIHPEYVDKVGQNDLQIIDQLANSNKVVAIGEIGLDYHYTKQNIEAQKKLFIEQIKIAHKHDLPICVHTRDAKEDTYQILKEYSHLIKKPSVMHCFSEDREYALKFLELGFILSFAGNITYKKSDRTFLKEIPIDKILVETDSPFLSPEPLRGRRNIPANVKYTAQKIADVLEIDYNTFAKQTLDNTYNVFTKMKRDV